MSASITRCRFVNLILRYGGGGGGDFLFVCLIICLFLKRGGGYTFPKNGFFKININWFCLFCLFFV